MTAKHGRHRRLTHPKKRAHAQHRKSHRGHKKKK